ncbi:MAG TPA: phosphodiester glycosidase family protein [Chloroflexia bacterium]|nr:phosphodiester glycosidase family protein [Chloroflexia bacterium]
MSIGAGRPRRRRAGGLRLWLVLGLLGGGGMLTLHIFGDTLVPPLVDGVRGIIGPAAMADVEAGYYGAVETAHGWARDLGLAPAVQPPWTLPADDSAGPALAGSPVLPAADPAGPAPAVATLLPTSGAATTEDSGAPAIAAMPPALLASRIAAPALPGEGRWTSTGLPQPPGGGPPAFWKTFLRPDPARPDALVYLVRIDLRQVRLQMVAGTLEPVSRVKESRPAQIAPGDRDRLAAAFNGGWKSVHGGYGMLVGGQQIAPPNPRLDTATLAVHSDGRITLAPWETLQTARDLVSYRQNCPMMIDNGTITVQNHLTSSWGLSALSQMYVWRSALGQTADGSLIYAAGTPISAAELALALQAAGAVTAMQLDINSAWVHWLTYRRDAGQQLRAEPLVPGMAYSRAQYLTPSQRDFFYLTWR